MGVAEIACTTDPRDAGGDLKRVARRILVANSAIHRSDEDRVRLLLDGVDVVSSDISQTALELCRAVKLRQSRKPLSKFQGKPTVRGDGHKALWAAQLTQVPGISDEIARVLSDAYETPASLVDQLERDPVVVANLAVYTKSAKGTQRIGTAVSDRLKTFFSSDDADLELA